MNFDRVATIYDATRAIPAGVLEHLAERIVHATNAGPETRFLELGVGTGRIALPLIQRGYPYTGIDISTGMMAQLRSKVGNATNVTVLEADMTQLPFPDASFDVVLAIHVFHLIPDWRRALEEARRVLVPGGYLLEARDRAPSHDPADEIRSHWRTLVEERGVSLRPSYGVPEALQEELTRLGFRIAEYAVDRWTEHHRPIDLLEQQRNRVFSLSWSVPDDVLYAVHEKMILWARQRFGSLLCDLSSEWEMTLSAAKLERSNSLP